jgi:hypothetical protein
MLAWSDVIDFALTLLAAAAGALLAAKLAFGRYRRERSLDRVADWHERVVPILRRMRAHVEVAAYWQEHGGTPDSYRSAREEFFDFLPHFREVTAHRVLYGLARSQGHVAAAEFAAESLASAWRGDSVLPLDLDLVYRFQSV